MKQESKEVIIDATNKVLGRLATEIADLLRGKKKVSFQPHQLVGDKVVVINAQKIRFTGKKLLDKVYYHHSGWPGGLKHQTLQELMEKNPAEVIRRAVKGMLPKNKLRKIWLKNLKIYRGDAKS